MTRRLVLSSFASVLAIAAAQSANAQVHGVAPAEVGVSIHMPSGIPASVTTISRSTPGGGVSATPPPSTTITPDTIDLRNLGTRVSTDGTTYTIDGGTLSGTNLFHSFQQFDLAAGDIAMWVRSQGDPSTISNVINRVTGGDPSDIFGTIDSTAIPNAEFYFINPAGIVFGNGAQVNVPAAATFSTASELRFTSGPAFQVAAPDGSTLSVASPQAFGFIGNEGAILVDAVDTGLLTGGNFLSLSASDILIQDSFVSTPLMLLTAVGSGGGVFDFFDLRGGTLEGTVRITDSLLVADDSALIFMSAGDVELVRSELDIAAGVGDGTSGLNIFATHDIRVADSSIVAERSLAALESGELIDISNSRIFTDSFDTLSQFGGSVLLRAADVVIRDDSFIAADNFADDPSFNGAGFVQIDAFNSLLIDGSRVSADTYDSGPAGFVLATAPDMLVRNSVLSSEAYADGDAGGITLLADFLAVQQSTISSTALVGDAGVINLAAGELVLTGSSLFTDVMGGIGGNISISATGSADIIGSFLTANNGALAITAADTLYVEDTTIFADRFAGTAGITTPIFMTAANIGIVDSLITAQNFSDMAGGGFVVINATDLLLVSASNISASGFGLGAAGSIFLDADTLVIDSSEFSSEGNAGGDAGQVILSGGDIDIFNTAILTDVEGNGFSGGISIDALRTASIIQSTLEATRGFVFVRGSNSLQVDSTIIEADISDTEQSGIDSGIFLTGDTVAITNTLITAENSSSDPSFVPGFIGVFAGSSATIADSRITANGVGAGSAGSIDVNADTVSVSNTFLTSNATGGGNAGLLSLRGGDIEVVTSDLTTNVGDVGTSGGVFLDASRNISVSGAEVTANSGTVGMFAGGQLDIQLSDILADNFSQGGGAIVLNASGISVFNTFLNAQNFSDSQSSASFIEIAAANDVSLVQTTVSAAGAALGPAGSINVTGSNIGMVNTIVTSSAQGGGLGGNIFLGTDGALDLDNSEITSETLSSGAAGIVTAQVGSLTATNNSFLSTSTQGAGAAGDVNITAGAIDLSNGSSFVSQSFPGSTGNAGRVRVQADSLVMQGVSFIDSSTRGAGNAGGVEVAAGDITIGSGSVIASQAGPGSTGSAGSVSIEAASLLIQNAGFVDSSTFGPGDAGLVTLDAATIVVRDGGFVTSRTFGSGDAGSIEIFADSLTVDNGFIASSAFEGSTGFSGFVGIIANDVAVIRGGRIETNSANTNIAGGVGIISDTILVDGTGSQVSSRNTSPNGGDAGAVLIVTRRGTISNGGSVTTDAESGAAGDILFSLPGDDGILIIAGADEPGLITTSSGTNSGGRISFLSPLAIVANGSEIRALGDVANALVTFDTPYLISSADRLNVIAVDGVVEFSSSIYDVSAGTVNPDLSVLDASGVLRGQCPAVRATGQLSQLTLRPIGPYAPRLDTPLRPEDGPPAGGTPIGGDCL